MAVSREPVRLRRPRPGALALLPVIAFVLAFGILPVALLFGGALSVAGPAGFLRALTDPVNVFALRNSLVQGAASAALATAVGYPVGVFLGRYSWPGRNILRALLVVPFLLPSVVVVVAVENLFGPGGLVSTSIPRAAILGHGLPGILAVNVLYNAPIVALLTAVGVESAPAELEDQVTLLGAGAGRRYLDVWGPPSWVGAAAGSLLTFVFSALAFAGPLLLCGARCYTIEARVWALDQVLGDPVGGALLALGLLLVVIAPTVAYAFLLQRLNAHRGVARVRPRAIPWRTAHGWVLALMTGGTVAGVFALLGSVVVRSVLTPGGNASTLGWAALLGPHVTSIIGLPTTAALLNTLVFATISSVIAVLLGVVTGFGLRRSGRSHGWLGALAFAPVVLSPVVLSFALATSYRPLFGGESTVWVLILLSQATLALPFALQSLFVPLRQLPPTPREAAETLGARPMSAFLDAELPRLRAGLVTAALFAFALSLGEFTATFFLATPRFTTLPVELYRLQALRQLPAASALSALLVVISVVTLATIALGGRRVEL